MSDINLLPKNNIASFQQEKAVAIVRRVALVILVGTAFISIAIFILVLQSPLSKAKQDEQDLITTISRMSNRISRNVIIQERLNSIEDIFKTRKSFEKTMNVFINAAPQGAEISTMDIADNTVKITGNSSSKDIADTFFSNLVALKNNKDTIKAVTLKSFSYVGTTGKYYFILESTLL